MLSELVLYDCCQSHSLPTSDLTQAPLEGPQPVCCHILVTMPLTPDILCCSYQLPLQSREHGLSDEILCNDSLVQLPKALTSVISSIPSPATPALDDACTHGQRGPRRWSCHCLGMSHQQVLAPLVGLWGGHRVGMHTASAEICGAGPDSGLGWARLKAGPS